MNDGQEQNQYEEPVEADATVASRKTLGLVERRNRVANFAEGKQELAKSLMHLEELLTQFPDQRNEKLAGESFFVSSQNDINFDVLDKQVKTLADFIRTTISKLENNNSNHDQRIQDDWKKHEMKSLVTELKSTFFKVSTAVAAYPGNNISRIGTSPTMKSRFTTVSASAATISKELSDFVKTWESTF